MSAPSRYLPYGRQDIGDDDIAAVTAVLKSDYLTTGPAVAEFEAALAAAVDAPHAVVCGNGTQALHLAALAVGLAPGDWAIVPSVTFLATANAVRYAGAEVVFADVDADTGLMTADHAEAAARRAGGPVKAVFPVHLGGLPATPAAIFDLARRKGWRVVEDACHALGTRYDARRVGDAHHADACVFSFHPVKTIAMGEGGAVTTRDEALAKRMRLLRNHGMVRQPDPDPWYYEMPELGFNYRAPDLNCALGTSQLRKLGHFIARRRTLAAQYRRVLDSNLIRTIGEPAGVEAAWHLFRAMIDFDALGKPRGEIMRALQAKGIGTQVHYIPVHRQPYYRERYGDADLPGALRYYERTLSLPLFPSMDETDVERVAHELRALIH